MPGSARKYPPEITRQKIMAWCDKAERCHWDVRNKLIAWNIPSAERENLISELISVDLLNEKRYASAFVNDKAAFNQWGIHKITAQLKSKGISERNILDALQRIKTDDTADTIRKLIKKKEPQFKGLQLFQKKIKLARFLLAKGFEYGMISSEIDRYYD